MSAITNWVLQRKAATILIAILVILAGIYSIPQLQEELLPNINIPYISVSTVYPGANAQTVADDVSKPIEATASQLQGVKQVSSTSLQGYSLVLVQFDYGANTDTLTQQLNTKLRSVSLPATTAGALQPSVSALNFNSQPILYISVEGLQSQSPAEVASWADGTALPSLEKITGVSNVEVIGDTSQQVTITLDTSKLTAHGLSVNDVTNTLQAQGLTYSAGSATVGSRTVPVRVSASYQNAQALGDILLTPSGAAAQPGATQPGPGGQGGVPPQGGQAPGQTAPSQAGQQPQQTQQTQQPVRLKDVATITTDTTYPNGTSRTNGQAGVLLNVYKSQTGNTVRASDGTLAEINTLNADNPGYKLTVVYDQAQSIRDSINGLVREGLFGALFAILVIFFFLRSARSTLVTAISIPTSILVAFILLWAEGITLNTLTLGGLAVAVGRVVDDAIVVLENIFRHVQEGEDTPIAVRNGAREVAGAITSSTITTVAVFLPLAVVGGITGQLFLPFALTVTFALLASLLVALTVIPVFAGAFITRRSVGKEPEESALQRIYTPILRWGLAHRWLTMGISAGLLILTLAGAVVTGLPTGFLPNGATNLVNVSITAAQGSDQSVTTQAVDEVERTLAQDKQQGKVSLYEATISGSSSFQRTQQAIQGSNTTATLLVKLTGSQNATTFAKNLQQVVQQYAPSGGSITATPSSSFNDNTLSYVVQGPDAASVKQGSDAVLNALKDVKNISNLRSDLSAVTPQVVVTPDPTKSAQANTSAIGAEISSLLQGQNTGTITFSDGSSAQVLVQVPGPNGANIDDYIANLKNLTLNSGAKLGDVATVQRVDGVTQVTRINQSLAATVSADITTENTGAVTQDASAKLRNLSLPSGVTISQSGLGQQQSDAFGGLGIAIVVAIALVYIIMVIAFGSLLEPFAILFSLPLAAIGGVGALLITRHQLNLSSLIGFLMLIGIVVTNAIVLMDLVNRLHKQGLPLHEAMAQAGRTRVRPILMTAVATILALLPLALGLGGNEGNIIAADLGVVVIGGLLVSTLLTLVVVPVVFSLLMGRRADEGVTQPVSAPMEQPSSSLPTATATR